MIKRAKLFKVVTKSNNFNVLAVLLSLPDYRRLQLFLLNASKNISNINEGNTKSNLLFFIFFLQNLLHMFVQHVKKSIQVHGNLSSMYKAFMALKFTLSLLEAIRNHAIPVVTPVPVHLRQIILLAVKS